MNILKINEYILIWQILYCIILCCMNYISNKIKHKLILTRQIKMKDNHLSLLLKTVFMAVQK